MYVRKTRDYFEVQGHYGHGWECVTAEETYRAAIEQLRCYRANEPGTPFRLRVKRERIGA